MAMEKADILGADKGISDIEGRKVGAGEVVDAAQRLVEIVGSSIVKERVGPWTAGAAGDGGCAQGCEGDNGGGLGEVHV